MAVMSNKWNGIERRKDQCVFFEVCQKELAGIKDLLDKLNELLTVLTSKLVEEEKKNV